MKLVAETLYLELRMDRTSLDTFSTSGFGPSDSETNRINDRIIFRCFVRENEDPTSPDLSLRETFETKFGIRLLSY